MQNKMFGTFDRFFPTIFFFFFIDTLRKKHMVISFGIYEHVLFTAQVCYGIMFYEIAVMNWVLFYSTRTLYNPVNMLKHFHKASTSKVKLRVLILSLTRLILVNVGNFLKWYWGKLCWIRNNPKHDHPNVLSSIRW